MSPSKLPRNKAAVHSLLDRLAAEEQAFLDRDFLAPVAMRGRVAVRIGGAVCQLAIEPPEFRGWGVFRPASHTQASLVREASLSQRREYLKLFPTIRLILCRRAGNLWYGSAASFGDARVQLDGLAPVLLADEVQLFDAVRTRFDGSSFWFDEIDARHDPATAPFLRAALAERRPPEQLARTGLTAEERAAYELNYWERMRAADEEHEENAAEPRAANPRHRRRRAVAAIPQTKRRGDWPRRCRTPAPN